MDFLRLLGLYLGSSSSCSSGYLRSPEPSILSFACPAAPVGPGACSLELMLVKGGSVGQERLAEAGKVPKGRVAGKKVTEEKVAAKEKFAEGKAIEGEKVSEGTMEARSEVEDDSLGGDPDPSSMAGLIVSEDWSSHSGQFI